MTNQDILNDFTELPKPAMIGKRIGAAIIDFIILCIIFWVISIPFGERNTETTRSTVTTTSVDGGEPVTTREITTSTVIQLNTTGKIIYFGCWFLLIVALEGRSGQTIGKMATRVKVIRLNGDPGNIGTSFLRHILDIVDCFLLIGLIIAVSNPQHKRIGDMAAGTYVVDKG